jgi:hypothetical protein
MWIGFIQVATQVELMCASLNFPKEDFHSNPVEANTLTNLLLYFSHVDKLLLQDDGARRWHFEAFLIENEIKRCTHTASS